MTTPTPPRLTGDTSSDTLALEKYMGDIYRSLVNESQLPMRASRLAAVPVSAIANSAPEGTKVIDLTPVALPAFTDPPTADEMEALRQLVNGLTVIALKIVQAAQLQR